MKTWIVAVLRRLLAWLDPPPAPQPIEYADPIDRLACDLVSQAESLTGSGEAKRHWVYAKLLKAFPDRPKREAGLAIELAIQARGDE